MGFKQVFASKRLIFALSFSIIFVRATTLDAQTDWWGTGGAANEQETGLTALATYRGTFQKEQDLTVADVNVGYNVNRHFGIDVGIPVFFQRTPSFFSSQRDLHRRWTFANGDPYLDLRLTANYRNWNLASVLTGTAPVASFRKGLSTGRANIDWFNHVDGSVYGFTPFVNFGLANGITDRHFLPRPYSMVRPFITQGFVADFEGGLSYRVYRRLNIGASMYDVLPGGPQTIYSRVVQRGEVGLTDGNHGRFYDAAFETKGPSKIARDNGYSAFVGISPVRVFDLQIGYTHSVRYARGGVTFAVAFNANSLARKITTY